MMIEGKLLSEQETSEIKHEIAAALGNDQQKFILDLKGVEYVNSAMLNFLVASKNHITLRNGKLVLCNTPEQLKKLLSVTKLESFFTITGRTALSFFPVVFVEY
jgi:anti-anti-sigma factor